MAWLTWLECAGPRQPLLNVFHLEKRFLCDRERLHENTDLAQAVWHHVHVRFVIDNVLGHESVDAVDSALRELTGKAEVLPSVPARGTVAMLTRPPNHRHDQIASLNPCDRRPNFDDLAERLVTYDEMGLAGRSGAVFEGTNLPIGTADADVENAHLHMGRCYDRWFRVFDQRHFASIGPHCNGFHHVRSDAAGRRSVATRVARTPWRKPNSPPGIQTGTVTADHLTLASQATATSGHDSLPPSLSNTTNVPWNSGTDRVVALAVHPRRLFLYWELTDPALDRARSATGTLQIGDIVVRLYDVTGRIFDGSNARATREWIVGRGTRQWFVDLDAPGTHQIAEVGIRTTDGHFVRIARSARAVLPSEGPQASQPVRWATVDEQTWSLGERPRHASFVTPSPHSVTAKRREPERGLGGSSTLYQSSASAASPIPTLEDLSRVFGD